MMHTTRISCQLSYLTAALLLLLLPSQLFSAEKNNLEAEQDPAAGKANTEQKLNLIEIYTWSNKLPMDLIDLQNNISSLHDVDGAEKQLPDLDREVEELEWQSTTLKSNPNLTFHELKLFEEKLARISTKLNRLNKPIERNIRELEVWQNEWLKKEKEFQDITGVGDKDFELNDALPDFDYLTNLINSGKSLLEKYFSQNLFTGHEIGKFQTRLYALSDLAASLARERNKLGAEQTSPSMLSKQFYEQIDVQDFIKGWENAVLFVKYQWGYLKQNLALVGISLLIILALAFAIHLTKRLTAPTWKWYIFASRPVITALFIFSTSFSVINALNIEYLSLPPDWETMGNLLLIFAIAGLIENVFKSRWQASLCRHLLVYVGLGIVFNVISLPPLLYYLFVFYASAILLAYYLLQFLQRLSRPAERRLTWAVLVWGVFPLLIIVAGIGGYDQLAVVLFGRILALITATLAIRILLLLTAELLELLLHQIPWALVKNNAATIVKQISPLLILLYIVLWLTVTLNILWVYPTLNDSFAAITSLKLSSFGLTVTPGAGLSIVLIVYITYLVSKGFQAFLLQEVLPARGVDKGVQISIARLVHYAILTIGFLVLLSALGFGLNQITILGGALGVGIGFGLQAIVNNFVSGLILLFERPIKVGDMIDVDNQVGEVKELGLRATVVQTFDNAEIVIPNSQLISGSVTNWTLTEKKIRVKVPVGVAYGSDIEKVLKILLACANDNPTVLSTPKPVALFLAFGASSLDFELRVWIADFNDKLTILSELNQEIDSEFQSAGIEIPFPQSDLHLRSIDQQALQALSGPVEKPEKLP